MGEGGVGGLESKINTEGRVNRQQRCAVINVALRSTWLHINDYEMRSIMFLFYPITLTMQLSQIGRDLNSTRVLCILK